MQPAFGNIKCNVHRLHISFLVRNVCYQSTYSISKDFDFGTGAFDKFAGLEGTFSHTRSVVYVRGKFWVIADHLKTDRPRKIEVLWHWHPDCAVQSGANAVVSTHNERGNLQIIPVRASDWKVTQVKGQEKPTIQGWYSKEYNNYEHSYSASENKCAEL